MSVLYSWFHPNFSTKFYTHLHISVLYNKFTCCNCYTWLFCYLDEDRCDPNPCQNNGTCTAGGCECTPLWTGPFCDIAVVGCWPSPCQNGGTCVDVPGSFMCQCPGDYTGIICETCKCN